MPLMYYKGENPIDAHPSQIKNMENVGWSLEKIEKVEKVTVQEKPEAREKPEKKAKPLAEVFIDEKNVEDVEKQAETLNKNN